MFKHFIALLSATFILFASESVPKSPPKSYKQQQLEIDLENKRLEIAFKKYKLDKAKFELEKRKANLKPSSKKEAAKPKKKKKSIYAGFGMFSGKGKRGASKGSDTDLILDNLEVTGTAIKVGVIGDSGHRFEVEINNVVNNTSIDFENIIALNANIFYLFDFPNKDFIPYFKFGIGRGEYEYSDSELGSAKGNETRYGLGIIMPFESVEILYSILFHDIIWKNTKTYDEDGNIIQTDIDDSFTTLNIGFNVLF